MLALDGGGVLGVIEIAFLERIEAALRGKLRNPDLVLADYFDLIGGTSTGAIIATGLALGMTAGQIKRLYFDLADEIFQKPLFSIPGIGPRFDARILTNKLRGILGERQLQTTDLKTGLAIVAKRVDTGSPWVITNNPLAKFWEEGPVKPETNTAEFIGNKRYLLRHLVRASTAAPYYYSPARMRIVESEDPGLFVDGGVSPHNNPALQLLMLASINGYGFNWSVSPDDLLLISIGCGWMRPRIDATNPWATWTAPMAIKTLQSVIWDSQVNALKILQWISEPRRPWPINSEVGTLEKEFLGISFGGDRQELLKFQRYDVMFEDFEVLEKDTGVRLTKDGLKRFRDFMNPGIMTEVYELAVRSAATQVDAADFPDVFDGVSAKAA
ncbi:MAG: patatin-like phospholipase family protein [Hyphomicrobiaceae bacterium]